MVSKAVLGSKGEIVIRKNEREASGIRPGDEVILIGGPGEVLIKKVHSAAELLGKPKVAAVKVEEFHRERRLLRRERMEKPPIEA